MNFSSTVGATLWNFVAWLPWPWIIFGIEIIFGLGTILGIVFGIFLWFFKYKNKIFIPHPIPIKEFWPPDEGGMSMVYGKPRNGKSMEATKLILDALERGQVVYADWIVQWNGIDERKKLWPRFLFWLGRYKHLYVIPKENFNYIHILRSDEIRDGGCKNPWCVDKKKNHFVDKISFLKTLSVLTDCYIVLDEAYRYISSYKGVHIDEQLQTDILSVGHRDVNLIVVAQRPTTVHVTVRGNCERFFKMTKIFDVLGIRLFLKEEFTDMADDTVDESESDHWELIWGRKKIYQAYNSKWMRQGIPDSQENKITAWK